MNPLDPSGTNHDSAPVRDGAADARRATPRAPRPEASELWAITRIAAPLAVAQLGLVSMGLVDTAILGHDSVVDLAGSAMGRSISFALSSLAFGIVSALEPLAAQALGAGESKRAFAALRATLKGVFFLWPLTTALCFATTLVLPPLGVEPEVVSSTRAFLLGHVPAIALVTLYFAFKTYLQAHSKTTAILLASVAANLVNAVACALLVRGDDALAPFGIALGLPRLGAFGAGLATSIAALVLVIVVAYPVKKLAPTPHVAALPLAPVVRLGLPIGLQLLAESGVFALVGLLTGRLGKDVVAAHQIALGLASFTFMGALGVSGATAVRVGHAVGAGASPKRAGLTGIAVGVAVMLVGAVVFAAFRIPLARVFTDEPDVIVLGADLLVFAALFQLFDGVQVVSAGALRGAGDVHYPFLANVVSHWLIGFPIAMALGFGFGWGARGLWCGLTAGLVAVAVALLVRFFRIVRRPIARV
jgi:MATE family multidrug resistance protein